jgi:hypothetical protein
VADATIQATEAPPPLPEYEQPPCPQEGYLWTPGYWNYAYGGYYWVPGTWASPPQVGFLWTPGYWGFVGGAYLFHGGYWGAHVGFYGGVNYGFGYGGVGFVGGRWNGNQFAYNTAVNNVNVTVVHNTYNETVVNNNTSVSRVSFNGGAAGTQARPTAQENQAMQERHLPPTPAQAQHVQEARANPSLALHSNGGHPPIAATPRPGAFTAPGVVGARGAPPMAQHPSAPSAPSTAPPAREPMGQRPGAPPAAPQAATPSTQHPNAPPGTGQRPAGQPPQGQPPQGQPPQGQPPKGQAQQPAKPAPKPVPKPKPPAEENRREGEPR